MALKMLKYPAYIRQLYKVHNMKQYIPDTNDTQQNEENENSNRNVPSLADYGIDDAILAPPPEPDEIIWVSKSEIKRDAEDLKKLGLELVNLSPTELAYIPLEEQLKNAIILATKIKKEGRRRQLQLIGKMLRHIEVEPIIQALDKLKNRHNQSVVLLHKLEAMRDALLTGKEDALELVMNQYPDADRQHLRALVRNAQKEQAANKPPKSSRLIYQYLKELVN
ncbi:ribosome-associated protein [Thorsellia anophelis DSM 18579]|uniref:Dual-action ribosomal maturation protein DarP n=2 Tax=Thorsellia anophelis TaxID=336804 RepID=A0A1H9YWT9_9GAMM|nr:ribosome-associated protein [Thorsellia anophelis DSM 18579]